MGSLRRLSSWVRATRSRRSTAKVLAYVAGWALIAVPGSYQLFMHDTRDTVIAGHDVTVSPTHDGYATLDLGAYLPNVRYPTDRVLGVKLTVGKTNLDSYESLLQRYALIGSHPDGEVHKVSELVRDMVLVDVMKGVAVGFAGPLLWVLIGPVRRRDLARRLSRRQLVYVAVGTTTAVVVTTSMSFVGSAREPKVALESWQRIAELVPAATIPGDAQRIEIQQGLITSGTQRLIASAFDSYQTSLTFYSEIADDAKRLTWRLRQPEPDETVALFVTDRHDNVGMDQVARAVGDAGGATVLFDGGDDTSTGEQWETFSLDSVAEAFDDYDDKFQVPGNHDNGTFLADYLTERGFTVLLGEPVLAADGIRVLGAPDPRSSGLGNWKTTTDISFDSQADLLADAACDADDRGERVSTLLVHDANLGRPALDRGCVDLLLGGHLHTQVGPLEVTGANGEVGVTLTIGTTGGAAYAVALGTKLRRDAQVSLITYRDGLPVGVQVVTIDTQGRYTVAPYYEMPSFRGQ